MPVSMVIDPKTNIKPKVYYDYLEDGTLKKSISLKALRRRKENRAEKKEKATTMFQLWRN
jgi:Zn/Cd-binding protein ZinT